MALNLEVATYEAIEHKGQTETHSTSIQRGTNFSYCTTPTCIFRVVTSKAKSALATLRQSVYRWKQTQKLCSHVETIFDPGVQVPRYTQGCLCLVISRHAVRHRVDAGEQTCRSPIIGNLCAELPLCSAIRWYSSRNLSIYIHREPSRDNAILMLIL